jgi:hypothetical protein
MTDMTPEDTLRFEHALRAYIVEAKARLDRILTEGDDDHASTPEIRFDIDGVEPVWRVRHYRWEGATAQGAQLLEVVAVWGERYRQQYGLSRLPALLTAPSDDTTIF